MDYLATFHTHFDSIKYYKYIKTVAKKATMKPVPRKLSSSCGSCVIFSTEGELPLPQLHSSDLEKLYWVNNTEYELILENK
jgi:hypothetical protein